MSRSHRTKFFASIGAGVAGLTIALACATPAMTTATSLQARSGPALRRTVATPTPCKTNYPSASFVGIPSGSSDVAGGNVSGVLAGLYNEACDTASAIGGGSGNGIGDGGAADYSFIGAGFDNEILEQNAFIGAGESNVVTDSYSFLGAGLSNTVSGQSAGLGAGNANAVSGNDSFDGAGTDNMSEGAASFAGAGSMNVASGDESFVGSGDLNSASGSGSFIGAGDYTYYNNGRPSTPGNQISGNDSFIGAGDQNTIAASEAFVGAGQSNQIGTSAGDAVVAGGNNNDVTGAYGAIGGGSGNKTSGAFAVVPGGADNEALGAASFAGGYHAEAAHNGSFVWSDDVSGSGYAVDGNTNEFVVRASGGTYFFSNEAESVGVKLAAGSGSWASLSDRNAKTHIVPLDDASILAKLSSLPVDAWQYKTEAGVRHVGPMAQDFYAAFGVGEDNRHITSIDEDGIALAAIKALHRENFHLRGENSQLRSRLARIERNDASILQRLSALEARK